MKDEAMTQLATRIPAKLMKELRVHCAVAEVKICDFIIQAIMMGLHKAKKK